MSEDLQQPEEHTLMEDTNVLHPTVPVSQQLLVLTVLLLIIFGGGFMPKFIAYLGDENTNSVTIPLAQTSQQEAVVEIIEAQEDPFAEIEILADAAYVWDVLNQKVLYSKSPDEQLPLASITKLMTALVAYEIISGEENVQISLKAIKQDGESGFSDGEAFTVENLIDLTLISSSNDGAFAIAAEAGKLLDSNNPEGAFVKAMNIRARELGLTNTFFRNPTGLDISVSEAGAYGSTRDVAFLMEYILINHPVILERTTEAQGVIYNNTGGYHDAENTNPIVSKISGIIGSKTGYTALAGGNLTVAFDASLNHPVITVVLASTRTERFIDTVTLTAAAREALQ